MKPTGKKRRRSMAKVRKTLQEMIEEQEKKKEAVSNRLKALKAREATSEKKADTRRKVILGAMVMHMAQNDDAEAVSVLERALRQLTKERDREVFADWSWKADPNNG